MLNKIQNFILFNLGKIIVAFRILLTSMLCMLMIYKYKTLYGNSIQSLTNIYKSHNMTVNTNCKLVVFSQTVLL